MGFPRTRHLRSSDVSYEGILPLPRLRLSPCLHFADLMVLRRRSAPSKLGLIDSSGPFGQLVEAGLEAKPRRQSFALLQIGRRAVFSAKSSTKQSKIGQVNLS